MEGGHLMWAQKKEGVSDSQGCPGVVVSTLSPKVCKLRMERESHTGRLMASEALFALGCYDR